MNLNFKISLDYSPEYQPSSMCFGGDGGGGSGGGNAPDGATGGYGAGGNATSGAGTGQGQSGQAGAAGQGASRASPAGGAAGADAVLNRAAQTQPQNPANPATAPDPASAEVERRRAIFRAIGVPGALADPANSLF